MGLQIPYVRTLILGLLYLPSSHKPQALKFRREGSRFAVVAWGLGFKPPHFGDSRKSEPLSPIGAKSPGGGECGILSVSESRIKTQGNPSCPLYKRNGRLFRFAKATNPQTFQYKGPLRANLFGYICQKATRDAARSFVSHPLARC